MTRRWAFETEGLPPARRSGVQRPRTWSMLLDAYSIASDKYSKRSGSLESTVICPEIVATVGAEA